MGADQPEPIICQTEPIIRPPAPPTQPAPLPMGAVRSSWPTVLGVVAIILGVLAALGGIWGVLGRRFMNGMVSGTPALRNELLDVSDQWANWTNTFALSGAALGVWLLVGGSGLAARRRWGRSVVLTWGIAKMLLVVAQTIEGYMVQQATFEVMMRQTGSGVVMLPAFRTGMGGVVIVFGLLWGWAGAVFALIWLSRAKIRAEVAEWK